MTIKRAYLSLGSNLGNLEENLGRALALLESERIHVVERSSIYETEPQDVTDQPWFLNMAVACETRCFPLQLLTAVRDVERQMGRVRRIRRGPRVIDIDILLFGNNAVMDTPRLIVPHPRMLERRFVLEPLLEIAPDLVHPVTRRPLRDYLSGVKTQKLRLKRPLSP
ncbi:MAG TPA: 2-amino-4-hydroxy-6-hydroxymethyldihydropteridine diphosphokinase [Bryobacteraceae bacterium]